PKIASSRRSTASNAATFRRVPTTCIGARRARMRRSAVRTMSVTPDQRLPFDDDEVVDGRQSPVIGHSLPADAQDRPTYREPGNRVLGTGAGVPETGDWRRVGTGDLVDSE